MNLRIFDNADDLTRAAARTIMQQLQRNVPATIGVSGGSTPQPLYELLGSTPLRDAIAETPVTWVVVDERYVPMSHPRSNASMIERTLFANGMSANHRFIRFETELKNPAATAVAFETSWRNAGIEHLDIAILGCGEDGHVASLFPGTAVLDVNDRVASEVFVPHLDEWRVTMTMPVLRASRFRMLLVAGEAKAQVIREVQAGVPHPVTLATAGMETWWFIDRAAASLVATGR